MLKFIFKLVLLVSFSVAAQQTPKKGKDIAKPADSLAVPVKTENYGLRVGIDLYRPSRAFYDDGFKGFEVVADYRVRKKTYAAAEAGTVDYTYDDYRLNYTTTGSYLKAGLDFNMYDNWLDMENMVYLGLRYGAASFSQNLNSYKIYQNSAIGTNPETNAASTNYFDEVTVKTDKKYGGLSAQWVEVVAGLKAKLFNNIYLGFSVRINALVANKKPAGFDNLYIPGFNRTYDGNFGAGFNYTLSYLIPVKKKQVLPKEKEVKKKK